MSPSPFGRRPAAKEKRHCEERSDEAMTCCLFLPQNKTDKHKSLTVNFNVSYHCCFFICKGATM
jgi:hypothetical protein